MNVTPAIVIVPVRGRSEEFEATLYVTLPVPLPEAPDVTTIHEALLTAVHAQPAAFDVTVTVADPPAAVGELAVGEIDVLQTIPACVTVNVWPPTVIVAVREVVVGFAATL